MSGPPLKAKPRDALAEQAPRTPAGTQEEFAAVLPALLRVQGPKLYSLALRLCGNAADAQDMLQETFLQAHRKWHTFRGESDPGTWIYAIAARMCKRRMRRKFAGDRAMPALSQVAPWTETTVSRAGLRLDGPFAALEKKEAEEALHSAIATLPELFRVPLILKEMLELPIAQVAAALGIRGETVKTRVHRARLLLRKALMRELPQRTAPVPLYEKRLCLDLLNAKLDAMDKGRGFPIGQEVICARCLAVFRELDLVQDTCARMAQSSMPERVRSAIREAIQAVDSGPAGKSRPAPGAGISSRATGADVQTVAPHKPRGRAARRPSRTVRVR